MRPLPCRVQALGGGWFNVVIHSCDGGFAEEAVLIVHQVLVDAGSKKAYMGSDYAENGARILKNKGK